MLDRVPIEIGAVCRAAETVCDRVLHPGVLSATISCVAARHFARFRVDVENTGIGLLACGSDTLGICWSVTSSIA